MAVENLIGRIAPDEATLRRQRAKAGFDAIIKRAEKKIADGGPLVVPAVRLASLTKLLETKNR